MIVNGRNNEDIMQNGSDTPKVVVMGDDGERDNGWKKTLGLGLFGVKKSKTPDHIKWCKHVVLGCKTQPLTLMCGFRQQNHNHKFFSVR